MITDDDELHVTQERITRFLEWLVQTRRTARPDEFEALTGKYRLEIQRLQDEVLKYLFRPLPVGPQN